MEFTTDTPKVEVTIQESTFAVPQPFAEKHVCTSNEAAALNQILVENTRNNFAKRVKVANENGTLDVPAMQKELDDYLKTYEFGIRRGAGPSDPVGKEANNLAREIIKSAIRKKGFKLSDVDSKQMNKLVADALEKNPEIRKEAELRVKRREKIGDTEMDLGL